MLCPLVGLSQYVDMWHFSVPYNETNIYEATEKEWYANVMSKAAKNQLINGWGMARRVGKDEKDVKYITWISFGDIKSRKNAYNSIGKYFKSSFLNIHLFALTILFDFIFKFISILQAVSITW